jgi:hypothetical protein
MVAYTCHPNYGRKNRIGDLRLGWPGQKAGYYLQNNQFKKGRRCGSNGRTPAKET